MKYKEIMTKGNYSLVLRRNQMDEYAVVCGAWVLAQRMKIIRGNKHE